MRVTWIDWWQVAADAEDAPKPTTTDIQAAAEEEVNILPDTGNTIP